MRPQQYINEATVMKLIPGPYGKKVRVIEGYDNFKRLYVTKHGKNGYCISDSLNITLDNMIEVNGEYWFGTLKKVKKALGI